jgi:hypothetical protein
VIGFIVADMVAISTSLDHHLCGMQRSPLVDISEAVGGVAVNGTAVDGVRGHLAAIVGDFFNGHLLAPWGMRMHNG